MSEEVKQEDTIQEPQSVKAKQYLVMADEMHMVLIGKLIPGLLFVHVEGVAIPGNDNHMLLANPLSKKEEVIQNNNFVS